MALNLNFPINPWRRLLIGLLAGLALSGLTPLWASQSAAPEALQWRHWSDDIFKIATQQKRMVLLDLEAVWCHWCHVMEEKTYGNDKIQELLKEHFIVVRADQDADPALSNRYGDWGWPATILFGPDGTELAKLSGYVPPIRMQSILQAFIDDPTPGPSAYAAQGTGELEVSEHAHLNDQQRQHLLQLFADLYDAKNGGWGNVHRYIHADSMDFLLSQAARGNLGAKQKAQQTLDAAQQLLDPVWGGIYQYSDQLDWSSPHYEKIMWYQVTALISYSRAYALWQRPQDLAAAKNIYGYLTEHLLSPAGSFYTSQDADVDAALPGKEFYAMNAAERQQLGREPRIDKSIYTRENAWAARALIEFYDASGETRALDIAKHALEQILAQRQRADGGFSHGANDQAGPYLGDNLAMGEAALSLYMASGERQWLLLADQLADYISTEFAHPQAGFMTAKPKAGGAFSTEVRQIEENIQLARFANLLAHTSGKARYRQLAEQSMRYLVSPDITELRRFLIGVVSADDELRHEPTHITVVGSRSNPKTQKLLKAALAYPVFYKRVDLWDRAEGPMLNQDISYPELEQPAAFACAENICSLPVFKAEEIAVQVERMQRLTQASPADSLGAVAR